MADSGTANVKSTLSKEELRRLMKERATKKIDSPLAKYDGLGQLFCVICKFHVKNEASWTAHVNGRQHLQTVSLAQASNQPKSTSIATSVIVANKQRPVETSVIKAPERKTEKRPSDVPSHSALKKPKTSDRPVAEQEPSASDIPPDFFDTPVTEPPASIPDPQTPALLPDNFFDKPTKNIKQKQEREKKAQEEEDWATFQRAINEESHKSAVVVEHDDAEAKRQRELDEIEEQLVRWEKLHDLELKKEEVAKKMVTGEAEAMEVESTEGSDDGEDFNLMDWRKRRLW